MQMSELRQMRFSARHDRSEVLWVKPVPTGSYRVLNVPVWVYGVSVGTLVRGIERPDGRLEFRDLVEPSPGGTIRYIVPEGDRKASELYLSRIGPEATRRGIGVGPATFLDPLIVALHLHDRSQWNTSLADYLNE